MKFSERAKSLYAVDLRDFLKCKRPLTVGIYDLPATYTKIRCIFHSRNAKADSKSPHMTLA